MNPVRPAVLGINTGDFGGQDKMNAIMNKKSFACRFQICFELFQPEMMGKIPCPHQRNAFELRPLADMRNIHVAAGGAAVFGMDMKIGNKHYSLMKPG